ncbi:MAG: hypothetical protein JO305_06965, partial [Alphaproteobacteria bacterium]|nr:hypothetical protein [Alphaproteobacteria bacterium]
MAAGLILSWMAVPNAVKYRVAQRDEGSGKSRSLYYGADAVFAVPDEAVEPGRDYAYRVEVLIDGAPDYVTLVPYGRPPAAAGGSGPVLTAPGLDEEAPAWRLSIRDDSDEGRTVLDMVSPRRRFSVDLAEVPVAHRLRYRFFRWDWHRSRWEAVTPFRKLPSTGPRFAPQSVAVESGEPGLAVRRARLVAHFVGVLKDRQLYFADASVLFYMGPEQQFEARLDGGGEGDLAGELGWILGRHP